VAKCEGECKTFGMDGDTCGEDGGQVGVFKERDEVASSGFPETMDTKIYSE
jgi:hypothetical protein